MLYRIGPLAWTGLALLLLLSIPTLLLSVVDLRQRQGVRVWLASRALH